MNLKLKRPLIFFDLETTGLDIAKDRIVQLAAIKLHPDGTQEDKNVLLNPTIPITKESGEVHGITDAMVSDEPTFARIAKSLLKFLTGCDLAGFNLNNFDIPLLIEEFLRCDINEFPADDVKSIDVGTIFKLQEPRTLVAAAKFYCDKDLEDAHDAGADTQATLDVLMGQIERYPEIKDMSVVQLSDFSSHGKSVGFTREFVYNDAGEVLYNFGKQKGQRVADDTGLAEWLLMKDFSQNSKRVARMVLEKIYQSTRLVN